MLPGNQTSGRHRWLLKSVAADQHPVSGCVVISKRKRDPFQTFIKKGVGRAKMVMFTVILTAKMYLFVAGNTVKNEKKMCPGRELRVMSFSKHF